ncbi:exosortase F system-associated membrane protein [Polaribacter sargassicola]|uniref:exosortase F system-associated membrane protein n=1 Tax=Polaribacter sargassicola TaxID=2836891 RepID=UPI001F19D072|nr:exosortase F system-associated protein [Polaribacter sp. DS7-9]MCG1035898.1 exosortase F system-associated protein [Polaribacter sp. DS7-9]
MNKYIKIIFVILLFILLILVRTFQKELFYDPLIEYFKNDYLYKHIDDLDFWRLILNMFYRYCLNSLISLSIIWVLFLRKDYFKFSVFFFVIAFVVLIIPFIFLLKNNFENGYLLPFYIRRFIIHPIFLLLLLPAFYYQKLSNK